MPDPPRLALRLLCGSALSYKNVCEVNRGCCCCCKCSKACKIERNLCSQNIQSYYIYISAKYTFINWIRLNEIRCFRRLCHHRSSFVSFLITPLYHSRKVVPPSGPYIHNYWFGNIYVMATSVQQQQLAFNKSDLLKIYLILPQNRS